MYKSSFLENGEARDISLAYILPLIGVAVFSHHPLPLCNALPFCLHYDRVHSSQVWNLSRHPNVPVSRRVYFREVHADFPIPGKEQGSPS